MKIEGFNVGLRQRGGDEGGWALRAQTSSPEPVFFGPKSMVVVPERLSTSVRVLSSTYAHTTWKTCSERDDKRKRKWGSRAASHLTPSWSSPARVSREPFPPQGVR